FVMIRSIYHDGTAHAPINRPVPNSGSTSTFVAKPHFQGAVFSKQPDFGQANFEAGAAFNAASFDQGARFFQTRFGALGVASFDGASFSELANFRETRFAGSADFVGVSASNATLDYRDAVFDSDANFHSSTLSVADFGNARFSGAARFTSVRLLSTPRCALSEDVSLNFERSNFGGPVSLSFDSIVAPINFSFVNFQTGNLSMHWDRVADWTYLRALSLGQKEGCESNWRFFAAQGGKPERGAEFYQRLEDNYRKQGLLDDATAVYLRKERAITAELSSHDLYYWWRKLVEDKFWGYGVSPENVIWVWLVSTVIFAFVYFFYRGRIEPDAEWAMPKISLADLPISVNDASREATPCPAVRAGRALLLSFSASTFLTFGAVRLIAPGRSNIRLAMVCQRLWGYFLIGCFTVALAQSVPLVGEVVSFLLK
ncbi:MAG: pentapeptide repeat-containing protein, partial [Alphaproteobacteria bacterium]